MIALWWAWKRPSAFGAALAQEVRRVTPESEIGAEMAAHADLYGRAADALAAGGAPAP